MQKIVPFLWFDGRVEEATTFYTGIFKNAKVLDVTRYGEGGPGPKGTVMSATFELEGQRFYALNGGPMFQFTPAISFFVHCETQDEVDHTGTVCSTAARRASAAGCRTASACRGRSSRACSAPSSATPIRRNPGARCRR